MSRPQFHGRDRTVSASLLGERIGDTLRIIKHEDRLTDADLGAVIGASEDSVARYRAGADMGAAAFLRGCATWNGRFANPALALLALRLVRMPQAPASRADLLELIARKAREASELTGAIVLGLSDGSFTPAEARAALTEAHQLHDVVLLMIAELEHIAGEIA